MAACAIALNRTSFSDYATAAPMFDQCIGAALNCIPADAADYERIASLGIPDCPVLDDTDLGLPPFWPPLCDRISAP
jgi:hypothetical protein